MKIHIIDHRTGQDLYSGDHRCVQSSAQARAEESLIRFVSVSEEGLRVSVSNPRILSLDVDGTLWLGQTVFSKSVVWSAENEKEKGNEE